MPALQIKVKYWAIYETQVNINVYPQTQQTSFKFQVTSLYKSLENCVYFIRVRATFRQDGVILQEYQSQRETRLDALLIFIEDEVIP
jgi:hypothetical protein